MARSDNAISSTTAALRTISNAAAILDTAVSHDGDLTISDPGGESSTSKLIASLAKFDLVSIEDEDMGTYVLCDQLVELIQFIQKRSDMSGTTLDLAAARENIFREARSYNEAHKKQSEIDIGSSQKRVKRSINRFSTTAKAIKSNFENALLSEFSVIADPGLRYSRAKELQADIVNVTHVISTLNSEYFGMVCDQLHSDAELLFKVRVRLSERVNLMITEWRDLNDRFGIMLTAIEREVDQRNKQSQLLSFYRRKGAESLQVEGEYLEILNLRNKEVRRIDKAGMNGPIDISMVLGSKPKDESKLLFDPATENEELLCIMEKPMLKVLNKYQDLMKSVEERISLEDDDAGPPPITEISGNNELAADELDDYQDDFEDLWDMANDYLIEHQNMDVFEFGQSNGYTGKELEDWVLFAVERITEAEVIAVEAKSKPPFKYRITTEIDSQHLNGSINITSVTLELS